MEFTKLSVKNFIADLPRIINDNFNVIKKKFEDLFPENDKSIKLDAADISRINCNTIQANNVYVTKDGKVITLEEYISDIIKKSNV